MCFGVYGGYYIGIVWMGVDLEISVVDENLKVYGVSNLYIVSSVVFFMLSQVNLMFMLLVLGLRLVGYIILKLKDSVV